MKTAAIAALGALAVASGAGAAAVAHHTDPGYVVTRVVDGDTIHADHGGDDVTIRVIGIDTPETVKPRTAVQPCGPEASRRMKELLPVGSKITLTADPGQDLTDKYGRSLGYVKHVNQDVGRRLVADGMARVYVYRGKPFERATSYFAAQRAAQRRHLGVWGAACATSRP